MTNETLFGVIGAGGTLFTVGYVIYRGFRNHDRKITEHDILIAEQDNTDKELKNTIDELESKLTQQVSEVATKVDRWMEKDGDHHEDIKSQISVALQGIAEIRGWIMGRQSSEKQI